MLALELVGESGPGRSPASAALRGGPARSRPRSLSRQPRGSFWGAPGRVQPGKRWGGKVVLKQGGRCGPALGDPVPRGPESKRNPRCPRLLLPPQPAVTARFSSAKPVPKRQLENANSAPFCVSAGARNWSLGWVGFFFNPLVG